MPAPVLATDNCYLITSPLLSDNLVSGSFDMPPVHTDSRPDKTTGRAPVLRVVLGQEHGILRHYYRGGFIATVSGDKFIWTGISRTRAVLEYRLLEWMTEKELPVPVPLGARVQRFGPTYTCDIITREIPDTDTLAVRLQQCDVGTELWNIAGKAIRKLHDHNVFHADLNANNILLDQEGTVTIIDFDKCRLRDGSAWKQNNIDRLKRSLDKLTRRKSVKHFSASGWQSFLDGYQR